MNDTSSLPKPPPGPGNSHPSGAPAFIDAAEEITVRFAQVDPTDLDTTEPGINTALHPGVNLEDQRPSPQIHQPAKVPEGNPNRDPMNDALHGDSNDQRPTRQPLRPGSTGGEELPF